ncbi:hypothetical protein Tco_0007307 [Tanacetum coccineum]
MSDSDESGVTYTEISSTFEELSDIGSPGVVPSPDYIPGPEEPQSPPLLDYVPEPIYPKYMPHEDEEDDDEDPEEDPINYHVDGGDNGDDEEGLSKDDEDDDLDIEANDDEEEEEHPAPADSVVVALPVADQAPSAEETESFETDESAATPPPHPAYRVTARISIPAPVPTPVWSDAEVARLLAISTLPSSPLSPWSSTLSQIPSLPLPPIPSPSLLVSPPLPVSSPVLVLSPSPPASLIRPLSYRDAMIQLRAEAVSTSHLLPLPPPFILTHTRPAAPSSGTPPLHLLSTDRREDRPEVTLPPRKRLGIALGPAYELTMDKERSIVSPEKMLDMGITDSRFETRDRRAQSNTRFLDVSTEARMSREAWVGSMGASDLARAEVMSLRTTVLAQQSQIRELQSADRRRQTVISELLAADYRRQRQLTEALKLVKSLQTQMAELQRQQGPAKGPAQPELPEEAGSSS